MKTKKAFTLIELLVVVAIIAVLVALLLPSLNAAREKARQTVCATHQRQIGLATMMYTDEWNGYLPRLWVTEGNWYSFLCPYLSIPWEEKYNAGVFNCPSTRIEFSCHYGRNIDVTYRSYYASSPDSTVEFWNRAGAYLKIGKAGYPDQTAHVVDRLDWWFSGLYWQGFNYIHAGLANFLFMDGHSAGRNVNEAIYNIPGAWCKVRYIEVD